jgi:hypothetical protein
MKPYYHIKALSSRYVVPFHYTYFNTNPVAPKNPD